MKKSKIIKKLIVMGLLVGTIASIGCGNVTTKTEENNGNDGTTYQPFYPKYL